MPGELEWREIAMTIPEREATSRLEQGKSVKTRTSQKTTCTICMEPEIHQMKYKLLDCSSAPCRQFGNQLKCKWKCKVGTCTITGCTSVLECNEHLSDAISLPKLTLTSEQKELCRQLASEGLRPKRIRTAIRKRFDVDIEIMPPLKKVQNVVNYHARIKLGHTDAHDDVTRLVKSKAFTGKESDDVAFIFTWNHDAGQTPTVGDGSDEEPILVGISTKTLLRRMNRSSDTFVLHLDATFKLSQVGYPVLVVGVSDIARSFHLVALFVMSQRTEALYQSSLLALRRVYCSVVVQPFQIKYVMGDAEAVRSVFGDDSNYQFLMCFVHVLHNVNRRINSLQADKASAVVEGIYNIHCSSSVTEFWHVRDFYMTHWRADQETAAFAEYFERQWLSGRYNQWQCYYTPTDFATSNNPVEQFNKKLKRDYTHRRMLKLSALLSRVQHCCVDECDPSVPFHCAPRTSDRLARRMRELAREGLLKENPSAVCPQPGMMRVTAHAAARVYMPARGRTTVDLAITAQMGMNYARMERVGQPDNGWPVSITTRWCPCRYWFKFGVCVHILFAMQQTRRVNSEGKRVMVNRRVKQKTPVPYLPVIILELKSPNLAPTHQRQPE